MCEKYWFLQRKRNLDIFEFFYKICWKTLWLGSNVFDSNFFLCVIFTSRFKLASGLISRFILNGIKMWVFWKIVRMVSIILVLKSIILGARLLHSQCNCMVRNYLRSLKLGCTKFKFSAWNTTSKYYLKQGWSIRGPGINFCGSILDLNSVIFRYIGCFSQSMSKIGQEINIFGNFSNCGPQNNFGWPPLT